VWTNSRVDSSILAKPAAIAIWLAICILATMFNQTVFGVFAGFVFLLTLSSLLWARASLKNVDIELTIGQIGMFPGQAFTVTRIVRNRKALPLLWAEIREPCGEDDPASPLADVIVCNEVLVDQEEGSANSYKVYKKEYERLYTLSFVRWRQSVFFKDEWQATRRGIMETGTVQLRSGDGFGLCAEGKTYTFSVPKRIVIYPRFAPVSALGILNDMWDTRSENDGYLKDRTVIKSVRDYQPGDAARDVNMRLLARGQTLMTNVFETVTPDTILFVLDSGSFCDRAPDVFERSLSVLASLIDELTRRGIRISLMTPASKWFPETCTVPSSLDRDRYQMLELLAAAARDDAPLTAAAQLPTDEPGRIYIVCADIDNLTVPPAVSLFPEHKVVALTAGETGEGGGTLRARALFDFERTA